MWRKISFGLLLLVVLVGTTGCISLNNNKTTVAPTDLGGVFISGDRIETWTNKSLLMTPGAKDGSISGVDVYVMRQDPSDSNAIYMGTRADGLYYSYNGGAGWNKADTLPAGFIRDIVVDAKNKCVIYVAVNNKIFKSQDCSRTWGQVFYSDSDTKFVSAMDGDWFDSKIIYAGLIDGTFLSSSDSGKTWKKLKQFSQRINKIIIDPNDSRIVYAGVLTVGLFKSVDKGVTWVDFKKEMKSFSSVATFYDFDVSKNVKNEIIYGSKFGLLKSLDAGATWTELPLLTKKNTETVYSITIDPKNGNNIYYGTDKAVYKSLDAGVSWTVKKLPTTREVGDLLVNEKDGKYVYMGVKAPIKQ